MIDGLLGAILRVHGIKVQRILDARLAGHIENAAVGAPERDAEILVFFLVKIGPGDLAVGYGSEAYANFGVALPCLGIMGAPKGAVLPERRIDGEHGHLGIVEPVERKCLTVRAPPECAVAGRTAEDFLVIDPRGIAVHDGFAAVEGQAPSLPGGDIGHPEVVFAGKGQEGGIRRIAQVHGSFGMNGKIGILLRGRCRNLRQPLPPGTGHLQLEAGTVLITPVKGENDFFVSQPFEAAGHLCRCSKGRQYGGHGK